MKSGWRAHAERVAQRVVTDNPGLPPKDLRKKLSEAYPFGERKYHPYKIWLDVVRKTLTVKPTTRPTRPKGQDVPGQLLLEEEAAQ